MTAWDPLVSTAWLAERLHGDGLVVLDCTVWLRPAEGGGYRAESGRSDHEAAHVPGARFADLTGALADADSPLRFAVPTAERFAAAMAALGVGDESTVVLYDRNRAMWAARVWWMLRWIGFDRAAVLDGGFRAWQDEGRPIEAGIDGPVSAGVLSVAARPRLIAAATDVRAAIGDGGTCLIDALTPEQFRGEATTYPRPGHIPGASNTPAVDLLDPTTGRFRPLDELRSRFPADPSQRVITYCGGGIAASSDAFVLTRLGFDDVAVYTASLQEWAADDANPLVTGD